MKGSTLRRRLRFRLQWRAIVMLALAVAGWEVLRQLARAKDNETDHKDQKKFRDTDTKHNNYLLG